MVFNSPGYLNKFIKKEIEKNYNVSLSGLFKRHRMKVPLIGDYIIFKQILSVSLSAGKKFNKSQIYNALRYSNEYNLLPRGEKMVWMDDLLKLKEAGGGG